MGKLDFTEHKFEYKRDVYLRDIHRHVNGTVYHGEWVVTKLNEDHIKEGNGVLVLPDGTTYQG